MLLFNSRNWNIIAPFIFNSVAMVHLSMSNCNNKAFARYRSVRVTGAVKFAETIGVRAARRGAACRKKKSDGIVCSRDSNWQPRCARTVSNFHSDKGGGFFFRRMRRRRVTASSLIANRASRARRVAIRTVYSRLSRREPQGRSVK